MVVASSPHPSYIRPEDYYRNFKESINDSYNNKLKAFMRFKGVAEGQFSKLVEAKDTRQNEADITDFIISLKEKFTP
jgi:hypothetical protein